ncbi:FGGY-family carbohydrate kinase [uncultured Cohaesibacter sp.]|uniref:FGGY-family carbohydrate kinase n=1 Tax=uncultured Cohaesibacter sp. TaxID=1002546 RepID=UPI0029C7B891|nr:FGGY-family carbohydrate kinase [uncultured Cohaesibacter sp.]
MEKDLLLGLDVGTTNVKALLASENGDVLGVAARRNPVKAADPGHSDCDMIALFERCCDVIAEAISDIDPNRLSALGVNGQGEGLWALDDLKRPIGPAIQWNDGRASDVALAWSADETLRTTIRAVTGSVPFSGATTVILAWLKQQQPETYSRIRHILWCKDWIRFCLSGELASDYTDASTSTLALGSRDHAFGLLERLGIAEAADWLPDLKQSYECGGHVLPEVAKRTGLPVGLPVAVGALDIVGTAIGMGARSVGDTCVILGTTCCCETVTESPEVDKGSTGGVECFALDEKYLKVTASMAGAPSLDWAIKTLMGSEERHGEELFRHIEKSIDALPPIPDGVIFHPYVSEAGERAPFNNPGAKAQFFGLSQHTDKWCMLKAVYEGVAFSILDCIGSLKGRLLLSGGGARSGIWPQIIADCTGLPVLTFDETESCAKGAAIFACMCANPGTSFDTIAARFGSSNQTYLPRSNAHWIYQDHFPLYRGIREQLDDIWRQHHLKQVNRRADHQTLPG